MPRKTTNLPYSAKHPILLPSNHPLTTCTVHLSSSYQGVAQRCEGDPHRATFEVLGDKGESRGEMIYSTITFTTCFRVREDPPFANTGVDFAGPLLVSKPGGAQSKVWIVLYITCVTQAIHL